MSGSEAKRARDGKLGVQVGVMNRKLVKREGVVVELWRGTATTV